MANMSYCIYENTVADMCEVRADLIEAAESGLSMAQFLERLSSDYERRAVREMIGLLQDLSESFEQLQNNEGLSEEELDELEAE